MNIENSYQFTVYLIIAVNVILSVMAFGNVRLFESLKFRIDDIIGGKQYYRLITSAFIHGGYFHLFINMYVLYSFSFFLQNFVSIPQYLMIYFGSLIVGNLLPLFIHKNDSNYSAVGASGAVSGVLYASIFFYPLGTLYLYFIPVKNWIFGILYLVYTLYGMKKNNDNIGHDAHFAGAVMGLLIAMLIKPENIAEYGLIIVGLMLPVAYYIFTLFQTPDILSNFTRLDKGEKANYSDRSIDDLYNYSKVKKEAELNALLEKVKKSGLDNLTTYERDRLDVLSRELR